MAGIYDKSTSTVSAVQNTGSSYLNVPDNKTLIDAFYDELIEQFKADLSAKKLSEFFVNGTMDKSTWYQQADLEDGGLVPLNADGSPITWDSNRIGFSYTWHSYMYRKGVRWSRNLAENDNAGIINSKVATLPRKGMRTMRELMADVMNRAINTGAGFTTAVVCADAKALVDSARPNPDPLASTWSNLQTAASLTEDYLANVEIDANANIAPNGDRLYQEVQKMYIPIANKKALTNLMESTNAIGNAYNDINYANRLNWAFEVVPELNADRIFFKVGENDVKNGLCLRWHSPPTIKDWDFDDPDIEGKRFRMDLAVGCFDPRYSLRGGILQ